MGILIAVSLPPLCQLPLQFPEIDLFYTQHLFEQPDRKTTLTEVN